jgi:RimJ/RimL family protein N-acetyltransferase
MHPVIETERLILRPPKLGDEKPLNEAINRSLPALQQWMPWAADPSFEPTMRFVKEGIASWSNEQAKDFPIVVFHKASRKIIGASGFNERSNPQVPMYEIGYWLDTQYTGLGLATETVSALTKFAFESFNAVRVQVVMQADNDASKRVAEKCGFVLEATLKKYRVDCLSKQPADDCIFVRFDAEGLL